MNKKEQVKFDKLYKQQLQALTLQGYRPKTIEAYSFAIKRLSRYFGCCPDNLITQQLKQYFADLLITHSWGTIKRDRNGIQFFYKHILNKPWDWVNIVRPPIEKKLPDILTTDEVWKLINTTHKLPYRIFFVIIQLSCNCSDLHQI